MENTVVHELESYALFQDADSSVLKLNATLEKYGYHFICVNLNEFESNFSHVVGLEKGFISKSKSELAQIGVSVATEIIENIRALYGIDFFMQVLKNNEIILLKKIENDKQIVVDNKIDGTDNVKGLKLLQAFSNSLLTQLRLLEQGPVYASNLFQIRKEQRFIVSNLFGPHKQSLNIGTYSIDDHDVEEFKKTFVPEFKPNLLVELAINNYNLCYDITDLKIRFTILMMCLESLFNHGFDQISHTTSRHLSIIISSTDEEFQKNYGRIKKLYDIRSKIVHGAKFKEEKDLYLYTTDLYELVRTAIKYCLPLEMNREDLFKKLNAMGFSK